MTARKILLPRIPNDIVEQIHQSARELINLVDYSENNYKWAAANDAVQTWCKQNISPDMYWGVQIIDGHLAAHKDIGTKTKFNYIIDAAGTNVITHFYDDDMKLVETVQFEEHTWYILDVTMFHEAVGVEPGRVRLSLTGRIFPTARV